MRDALDQKILALLQENGRITVKEIAAQISLTAPAVSERMRKLETEGIIQKYNVVLDPDKMGRSIHALISVSVPPKDRQEFLAMIDREEAVVLCHHVTGPYSYIVRANLKAMSDLEDMITHFQKYGETNTQIIMSTPIEHPIMF